MHREPDVGFDPASPGWRPGPKAGAKPLRHPGIPQVCFQLRKQIVFRKVCGYLKLQVINKRMWIDIF